MNRKKIKIVVAGLMGMFLLTSCVSDLIDKTGSPYPPVSAWGEILRHEGKGNFDIVMDNNDTLRTINTSHMDKDDAKTGTRVLFNASIDEIKPANPYLLCTGSLMKIVKVPVEKPILLSWVNAEQDRVDSLGNDPIEISKLSVSGKYLNVEYNTRRNDGSIGHTISFVVDDINEVSNGVLNVNMRHNGNGDVPASPYNELVSCNIKEYMDAASGGTLTVNLSYNNGGANDLKKTVTWVKPK